MNRKQLAILEAEFNPRFRAVLERCLSDEELIKEFERLWNVNRPRTPRTAIEAMVDEVTGFRKSQWGDFLREFIPFVYEFVWLTWNERNNEECWK